MHRQSLTPYGSAPMEVNEKLQHQHSNMTEKLPNYHSLIILLELLFISFTLNRSNNHFRNTTTNTNKPM